MWLNRFNSLFVPWRYSSFPRLKSDRTPEQQSHSLSYVFQLFDHTAVAVILAMKAEVMRELANEFLFPRIWILSHRFDTVLLEFKNRELLVADFRSSYAILTFLGSKEQNNKQQSHISPHISLTLWSYRFAFDCCCCRRRRQRRRQPSVGVNEGRFTLIITACCF